MVFIFFLEKIRRRNSHDSYAQVHRDKEKASLFISFNKFFWLFLVVFGCFLLVCFFFFFQYLPASGVCKNKSEFSDLW